MAINAERTRIMRMMLEKHPEGPFVVLSREEGEREADKSPTFIHTFEKYLLGPQQYLGYLYTFANVIRRV
jgi:hypothetical protein